MAGNTIFTYGITIQVIMALIGITVILSLRQQFSLYLVPYLPDEASIYLIYVGGVGGMMSCLSTSMRPFYRIENRGTLEVVMDISVSILKIVTLLALFTLLIAD